MDKNMQMLNSEKYVLKAYAKVNLGLQVIGKRNDGYYNIHTIMQKIDFYDELTFALNRKSIQFSTNSTPHGRNNICYKAARLFLNATGIEGGAHIKLKKKIWVGGGLGGGSSDAATTLLGLNKLFDTPLNLQELYGLALSLGSDVPFFLNGSIAEVRGRGEIISSLKPLVLGLNLILVYPKFPVSTSWAYENIENHLTKKTSSLKILLEAISDNDLYRIADNLCNDFEKVVMTNYPILKKIKERLYSLGALGVSLSGSGSCMYGILPHDYKENELRDGLSDFGTETKITKTIDT
jgi:4-diphosphocytidyl-2-C-methyl-D-erythritol kinase